MPAPIADAATQFLLHFDDASYTPYALNEPSGYVNVYEAVYHSFDAVAGVYGLCRRNNTLNDVGVYISSAAMQYAFYNTGEFRINALVKCDVTALTTNPGTIYAFANGGAPDVSTQCAFHLVVLNDGRIRIRYQAYDTSVVEFTQTGAGSVNATTWTRVGVRVVRVAGLQQYRLFINNVLVDVFNATKDTIGGSVSSPAHLWFSTCGARWTLYKGSLDEVWIQNTAGADADMTAYAFDGAAPGAPTGVSAVRGNTQVAVSWSAPSSDGGSAITGYTVTASPGGATLTVGNVLTGTVTGLTNGTAYTFTVHATNSLGSSAESSASAAVTPSTTPSAPLDVSAVAGVSQASVLWDAPSTNGGAAITGYVVTASPGGATATVGAVLTATVTGLTGGVVYTFTVHAVNASGAGPESDASIAVTPYAVPGTPGSLAAVALSSGEVGLTWTAPAANGSALTGYLITSSGGATLSIAAPATSVTFSGLVNGEDYSFTIHAINAVGAGAESAASNTVTARDSAPPVVTVVSPSTALAIFTMTPLVFDVTDIALHRVILAVGYGTSGDQEVVFDGQSFTASYARSTQAVITNGFRFTLQRRGGWTASPTLHVYAADAFGNEA